MRREVVVSSVTFTDDGVDVQFMVLPDDVRCEAHVVLNRSAAISYQAPDGLGAATSDLRTAVHDLVSKLLDGLEAMPVYVPDLTERLTLTPDDDEDVGMGDGR